MGTLDTVETVDTADTGETVLETNDRSRFRKTLMCITGGDSDNIEEKHLIDARPSQGTFDKFPHYFREA